MDMTPERATDAMMELVYAITRATKFQGGNKTANKAETKEIREMFKRLCGRYPNDVEQKKINGN